MSRERSSFFAYNFSGKHFNPTSCGVIRNQRSKIRLLNIMLSSNSGALSEKSWNSNVEWFSTLGLYMRRNKPERVETQANTSPMTSTVTRLVMVSHITSILPKYFPAIQTTRMPLFKKCVCVAAITQSSDLRGGQSNLMHSRWTRDASKAAGLVTHVVASLTNCVTQSPFNSLYKLRGRSHIT